MTQRIEIAASSRWWESGQLLMRCDESRRNDEKKSENGRRSAHEAEGKKRELGVDIG